VKQREQTIIALVLMTEHLDNTVVLPLVFFKAPCKYNSSRHEYGNHSISWWFYHQIPSQHFLQYGQEAFHYKIMTITAPVQVYYTMHTYIIQRTIQMVCALWHALDNSSLIYHNSENGDVLNN